MLNKIPVVEEGGREGGAVRNKDNLLCNSFFMCELIKSLIKLC